MQRVVKQLNGSKVMRSRVLGVGLKRHGRIGYHAGKTIDMHAETLRQGDDFAVP